MRGKASRIFYSSSAVLALVAATASAPAFAQDATAMSEDDGAIIVTGTRIKSAGLSSTSPISTLEGEQIQLLRAVTIEDISVKIPQLERSGYPQFELTEGKRPGLD